MTSPSLKGSLPTRVRIRRPERNTAGQFVKGWRGGHGNPLARRVNVLRSALLAAVTPHDLRAVVRALVQKARRGDLAAAHELLNRVLGKPIEADLLERLDALEERLGGDEGGAP